MLEEAADEFLSSEGTGDKLASFGGVIAERHLVVFQFEDALVADGNPENVGGQVLQGAQAIAHRLASLSPAPSLLKNSSAVFSNTSYPRALLKCATMAFSVLVSDSA